MSAFPVNAPTKDVDVIEVKPVIVVAVAPRLTDVEPIVTELLAKLAFVIPAEPDKLLLVRPVIVFEPAAIVLFVRVCEPVRVATVESISNVTLLFVTAEVIPVPPTKVRVSLANVKVSVPVSPAIFILEAPPPPALTKFVAARFAPDVISI